MTRTVKQMFGILLVLLVFPISILAESGKIVSNGGKVNVRKLPEDKARIVMTVKKGTTIEVLDHSDGWYHIRYNGKEGYIKDSFVKLLSESIGKEIYSNGSTLFLHESMDESSRIIGMINAQQAMTLERIDEQWALVSNQNTKGYVRLSQIDELNNSPVAAAEQTWTSGILQSETKLYKAADSKSEVVATWPKGTGVSVSSYDKNWCLIQVLDEDSFGFAKKSAVKLTPRIVLQMIPLKMKGGSST